MAITFSCMWSTEVGYRREACEWGSLEWSFQRYGFWGGVWFDFKE
jgi:hypothetical protein